MNGAALLSRIQNAAEGSFQEDCRAHIGESLRPCWKGTYKVLPYGYLKDLSPPEIQISAISVSVFVVKCHGISVRYGASWQPVIPVGLVGIALPPQTEGVGFEGTKTATLPE
jgi:hypothetical protein